ncbi:acyl-CoA dehydrogenase family protein [Effusibacillus dendaii]|uniref:Putative acyl-CoA dehydrogenase n=1 Tax=Effusibacillus dendaii TaxID=2743772 RepID=A0A7I8D834_9BACL|nr:acyl-CoA dehydrogenase family protein [Effusibacillus dendaii]BCJ85169.1 putative acyl-CoA dehydrogenase [Effusibacillus dendaii]
MKTVSQSDGFLFRVTNPNEVFTPEEFTPEQKQIRKTTRDFVGGKIAPESERIESLDVELSAKLLREAGELGLLGAHIPEAYGGLELDTISTTLISEEFARAGSLSVAHGNHTGIATWPLIFYGTEEQKKKYLAKLATAEMLGAYALTEPGSGSDALGARSTARLNEAGSHYILNGQKQWITNAGFADVYIVYAKVDGEKFTAFIVDANSPGITTGPEEKKMGISGSSTRMLYLEDVAVPVENVLGEVGKGHLVAFNALNIGRYKVGSGTLGSAKAAFETAATYASVRHQFNRPLASFGLIQEKLADMTTRIFAAESMIYRIGGLLDGGDKYDPKFVERYAVECSIAKVYGSETLDFVVDESLQIHGGYGYMKEYPIENMYRSSRINRIFEGSNEINRLLIPGTLLRRANKGELPLFDLLQQIQQSPLAGLDFGFKGALAEERQAVESAKRLFLCMFGLALQAHGGKIDERQEIMGRLANIAMEIFASESGLLRAEKSAAANRESAAAQTDIVRVYTRESLQRIQQWATAICWTVCDEAMLEQILLFVNQLTRISPLGLIPIKRKIAERAVAAGKYTM